MAVHDVRHAAFAVQARTLADELEIGAVGVDRQMALPAEARRKRAFDGGDALARAERAVHREALHVIGRELRGHDARGDLGRLIDERAADNDHERSRQRHRRQARAPTGLTTRTDD